MSYGVCSTSILDLLWKPRVLFFPHQCCSKPVEGWRWATQKEKVGNRWEESKAKYDGQMAGLIVSRLGQFSSLGVVPPRSTRSPWTLLSMSNRLEDYQSRFGKRSFLSPWRHRLQISMSSFSYRNEPGLQVARGEYALLWLFWLED